MKQLAKLTNMENPQSVYDEVRLIASMIKSDFNHSHLDKAFVDTFRLFNGEYPGYRGCNILYHDFRHTMAVLLAMARLMHGYVVCENVCFTDKEINIGLISALMHDSGYQQTIDDIEGTGAKHTLIHVQRSIDFVRRLYKDDEYFRDSLICFKDILNCTGLKEKVKEIEFSMPAIRLLGLMLGTADLLGQMADRHYLEKLVFLFHEFQEANINTFTSELDLLRKTIDFYETTKIRFAKDLGGVNRYMIFHFQKRWNINDDMYQTGIERNIKYLNIVLNNDEAEYRHHLRRADLMKIIEKEQPAVYE
jgi:hypothetical protein